MKVDWVKVFEHVNHLKWLMNDVTYKAPEQYGGCEEDLRRTVEALAQIVGIETKRKLDLTPDPCDCHGTPFCEDDK